MSCTLKRGLQLSCLFLPDRLFPRDHQQTGQFDPRFMIGEVKLSSDGTSDVSNSSNSD